jgi:uncharacterized protein (DUF2252 family)
MDFEGEIKMEPSVVLSKREREQQGKARRENCPRSVHADWRPRSKSQDIIKLLEESDEDRIPGLIPLKYQRMAESPFKFFRGAAVIQARDLANSQVSGITVQACGDCHLMNFGGFATPERTLVFDINDFDETFPGPWEWDIKRLCASFVLAARDRSLSKQVAKDVVRAAASTYRKRMSEFAQMKVLDVWYAQVNADTILEYFRKDKSFFARLSNKQKQAQSQTSERVFPKLTSVVNGRRKIKDNPPILFHFQRNIRDFDRVNQHHAEQYRKSLQADRLELVDHFRLQDSAVKVVGVGSVGTRCYVHLLLAEDDDPLFLQSKEARRSVLESPRGKSRFAHQGFRVVAGQRLMQSASDIFLGWFRSEHGHDYYVRQFRDMKVTAEPESFKASNLESYAIMCGWALARAHAKAGDASMISGYLGSKDTMDEALVQYSMAYADQAERDFAMFQAAIRSGRLSTEPTKAAGLAFLE